MPQHNCTNGKTWWHGGAVAEIAGYTSVLTANHTKQELWPTASSSLSNSANANRDFGQYDNLHNIVAK